MKAFDTLQTQARASLWVLRPLWLLPLGVVALLTVTALSTYNAVTTDRFIVDLAITRWVQRFEVGESLGKVILFTGVEGIAGVVMGTALLWQWFRGHRVDALLLLFTLTPNGFNFLLRDIYGRPRPESLGTVNVIGGPQGESFPSGHAILVIFLYGFLLYLLPKYTRSRRWLYTAWVLFLLYLPFSGLWLIHHGRHWASDVLGGYLYGLLYLVLWMGLYPLAKAWEGRHPGLLTMATVRRLGTRLGLLRGL